jgi:hypothetical protein
MRFSTIAAVTALLTVTAADAQNVRAPVSTDPGAPTAPSKPARAKKPSAVPPFIVTLANASTHTAVMVIITTEDAIASTSKPLGPKAQRASKVGVKLMLASSTSARIRRSASRTDPTAT